MSNEVAAHNASRFFLRAKIKNEFLSRKVTNLPTTSVLYLN